MIDDKGDSEERVCQKQLKTAYSAVVVVAVRRESSV
jgi:hypothetical protein